MLVDAVTSLSCLKLPQLLKRGFTAPTLTLDALHLSSMLAATIFENYAASLGFSPRSSAAKHKLYDSILDRAFTFLHRPTPAARPHSFSSLSRTPPNALRHLHSLKREVRTASPAFERARMAFQFASAGTSDFGGNAGGTSNAQTQTGPDLEEIQTEVR